MRSIQKRAEPPSLTTHRLTAHCNYDNYADRAGLRQALVHEQRGLCCYCMSRIRNGPDDMKVEHWQSQRRYPAEQLAYQNLLGACLGGAGLPGELQHCDTKKGDLDLRWNPANPAHHVETQIRYEPDGSIRSGDPQFNRELCAVLNLNLPLLKQNRKGILDAVLHWWKHEKARLHGPVSRATFERERDRRVTGTGLEPFCQVAVWWLEQRLLRMAV